MIRITIELVPHGDASRAKILARGEIVNDGSGTVRRGNYYFWLSQSGRITHKTRWGQVRDFPRMSKNVWHLLARCLNTAFK